MEVYFRALNYFLRDSTLALAISHPSWSYTKTYNLWNDVGKIEHAVESIQGFQEAKTSHTWAVDVYFLYCSIQDTEIKANCFQVEEYTSDDYISGWMQRICNFSHLIVILYTMSSNNNSFFYPTPITQQLDSWSLAIVDLSYSVFAVMQMLMSHHDILNQKLRKWDRVESNISSTLATAPRTYRDIKVSYAHSRTPKFVPMPSATPSQEYKPVSLIFWIRSCMCKKSEKAWGLFSGFPDNPTPDSIHLYVERVNRTIQRQVAKYAKHLDKWDDSAFRNYGGPYYHFINRFAEFFVLRCIHHLYRKHI